jgi:HD-like signal output (HDOD) protein
MANSAALATGSPVTDVRAAVQRLGFDALRSAVFSFAVGQLRKAAAFREIEKPLNVLWQQSVAIAAAALLLSKKMQRGAPDTAMLAGLMSGVGKLYILTRAQKYPALFGDPASYDGVVTSWHASVARSILENWGLADELVDAVAGYEEAHIEQRSKLSLADLVAVAQLLTQLGESPDMLQAALAGDCAAVRVGITAANCTELMADIKAEVESLRASMGG